MGMSDFFREATTPHARKRYVCEACGWFIPVGEQHYAQTGVYEGLGFSNRFHNECWKSVREDEFAVDGFMTGDYPVPARFAAEVEAARAAKGEGRG
jgi:hypothetical protein